MSIGVISNTSVVISLSVPRDEHSGYDDSGLRHRSDVRNLVPDRTGASQHHRSFARRQLRHRETAHGVANGNKRERFAGARTDVVHGSRPKPFEPIIESNQYSQDDYGFPGNFDSYLKPSNQNTDDRRFNPMGSQLNPARTPQRRDHHRRPPNQPAQHNPYDVSRRDPCMFMKKMHLAHYIGRYGSDMMCKMYSDWGKSMMVQTGWKPTQKQRHWFDSLGSGSEYRTSHQRHKRQVSSGRRSKSVRKEYRMLTDRERSRLHRAMNALKRTDVDGMSKYDVIAQMHAANRAPAAHFGPAFLGFHREYLLR